MMRHEGKGVRVNLPLSPPRLLPDVRVQHLLKPSVSPTPVDLLASQSVPVPHLGAFSMDFSPGLSPEGLLL